MLQQAQRLTELSAGVDWVDSERTPGFREFCAVGFENERQVSVTGGGQFQGLL